MSVIWFRILFGSQKEASEEQEEEVEEVESDCE